MERVYLVRGFTGEYADKASWVAGAYLARAEAERHLCLLEELLEQLSHELQPDDYDGRQELQERVRRSGLDRGCLIQYTGVRYALEEIPLSVLAPDRPQPARRPSALAEPLS